MHKCQGTSQLLLLPGAPASRTYRLKDSVIGEPGVAPKDMFDGIDTTIGGLAAYTGAQPPQALAAALKDIASNVAAATEAVETHGPGASAAPLANGLAAVRDDSKGSSRQSDSPTMRVTRSIAGWCIEGLAVRGGPRADARHPLEALADDGTVVDRAARSGLAHAGNNGSPDVSVSHVTSS